MIPSNLEQKEAAFGYVGGILNACYLAGFARRLEMTHVANLNDINVEVEDTSGEPTSFEGETRHLNENKQDQKSKAPSIWKPSFYIQQINNENSALPIFLPKSRVAVPQDAEEIKVIGRMIGRKLPNGETTLDVRALQLSHPSIRDMPNFVAWNKLETKASRSKDTFKPFFDPTDQEDFKLSPFAKVDKNHGRPCLNRGRLAGFIQSFQWNRSKDNTIKKNCILLTVRQTANPDEAIPCRITGTKVEAIMRSLSIGLPVFIEGQVKVKVYPTGQIGPDGLEIVRTVSFLHSSDVLLGTRDVIQVEPPWYEQMRRSRMEDQARKTAELSKRLQEISTTTQVKDENDFQID